MSRVKVFMAMLFLGIRGAVWRGIFKLVSCLAGAQRFCQYRGMNWRPLLPCAGLLGGAFTGWQFRQPPAGGAPVVDESQKAAQTAPINPSSSVRATAVTKLSELQDLWGADGAVGIYELLDGVPAATLAAWLNAMMPPETFSRSVESGKRDGIRDAIVERLAKSDPAALAAWLLWIPKGHATGGGEFGGGWMKACVHALLHQNSPDAMALLDQLERQENTDSYAAHQRLVWLVEHDPQAALQRVTEISEKHPPPELARWIAADPARALTFANEHPDRCFTVLAEIAEKGSAALREFAAGLTAPEAQRHIHRLLLTTAAREGDAEFIARHFAAEGRDSQDSLQDMAIETLARIHPEKSVAMAQEFSGQSALVNEILGKLATSHPVQIATMLAVPDQRKLLTWHPLNNMARTWSLSDPAGAQGWLRALPDDQLSDALPFVADIADDLPDNEWLALSRGLPVDAERANGLTRQMVARSTDPAALADWCASFPDGTREHILHRLRENLRDDKLADDVARRVLAAVPPETP